MKTIYENIKNAFPYEKHYTFKETGIIVLNLKCKRIPESDAFCAYVCPDGEIEIVCRNRHFAYGKLNVNVINTTTDVFEITEWK